MLMMDAGSFLFFSSPVLSEPTWNIPHLEHDQKDDFGRFASHCCFGWLDLSNACFFCSSGHGFCLIGLYRLFLCWPVLECTEHCGFILFSCSCVRRMFFPSPCSPRTIERLTTKLVGVFLCLRYGFWFQLLFVVDRRADVTQPKSFVYRERYYVCTTTSGTVILYM